MSSFDIDVTRDGGWWMVHIPKLGGLTQSSLSPRGRANGTRVHRSQYRYAHRPGGYQLASLHAVTPEGQERSRMRCMELTEALVTEDITPFERERLREALEEEVRRQLPADSQLLRVVDWDPAGGHAVESAPGMRKYRVAYETEPRD
jgi:hypothetical protein